MANTLTFASVTLTDADIYGGISFLHDLNTGDEFTIGNTASASVRFTTDTQLPLYTKDSVNGVFTWTQDGVSRGTYYITEVTKANGKYDITAYDAMILLDAPAADLPVILPMSAADLADEIAAFCECTVSGTILNGTLQIAKFDKGLTMRQLLAYIAEASGCSAKIDSYDQICFMYYEDSGITVTPSRYVTLEVADYTCAAIDKVVIIDSLGIEQAEAGTGTNTLYISHNPFLENATEEHAAVILGAVEGFVYAPLTCELFTEEGIEVGTIATFGSTPTLVMHMESSEDGAKAVSVGSDTRAGYNKSIEDAAAEAVNMAASLYTLEVHPDVRPDVSHLTARLLRGTQNVIEDYNPEWFKWSIRTEQGQERLGTGYEIDVDMTQVGYAATVLCTFITPRLYHLTDHNLTPITDQGGEKIQVAYSEASNTKEVNLYEKGAMSSFTQHFWTQEEGDDAGAHITEIEKDRFLQNPEKGGGNLLAQSRGILVRDGLETLASFGADGMVVGKTNEKHILIEPTSFNVVEEDGSAPFFVSTKNSSQRRVRGVGQRVQAGSTFELTVFLNGKMENNELGCAVSTSGYPTTYSNYITLPEDTGVYPSSYGSVVVDGVAFYARWTAPSTYYVLASNRNSTERYVMARCYDIYYETQVKANDASLSLVHYPITFADTIGTSLSSYCYADTYGHVATVQFGVYNTNAIASGGLIYQGKLTNVVPASLTYLMGGTNTSIIKGFLNSSGELFVYNSTGSSITSTSSNPITLHGTYVFQ